MPRNNGGYMKSADGYRLDDYPVGVRPDYDIIIVGGSEFAVVSAVAAARQGVNVLILAEGLRLGGVTGWALTQTDMLNDRSPGMIFGIARELFELVARQKPGAEVTFEQFHRLGGNGRPAQWERAINTLLSTTPGITVVRNAPLTAVSKTGLRINSITAGGIDYTGRVFLDATATGDLIRQAGVTTRLGRESAAQTGETASALIGVRSPVALTGVDPYITPGNAGSGLLYGVDASAAGTVGAGDGRVMASGIRTYITKNADKGAWPAPSDYQASRYELIARIWASNATYYNGSTAFEALNRTFLLYDLTGDANELDLNHRLYPTTYPKPDEWLTYIDGTEAQRAVIAQKARNYFLGLVNFILTSGDSRVPANLKTAFQTYGPSIYELRDSGGVSPQVYVREARRLVGDFVLTKDTAVVASNYADYIAWGAYNFDAKDIRIIDGGGVASTEGAFESSASALTAGFPIPYRVLTPKATECSNLLSPGQPSVSRYVWTAVRAIPVLLCVAHAAGVAAALAAKSGLAVQNIDVAALQKIVDPLGIYSQGAIVVGSVGNSVAGGTFGGIRSGASDWNVVSSNTGNMRWPGWAVPSRAAAANNANPARYAPNIYKPGMYRVEVMYPATTDADGLARATNATLRVVHGDGTTVRTVSLRYPGGSGGFWDDLGVFFFGKGTPSPHYVEFDAAGANGSIVDGFVRFTPVR